MGKASEQGFELQQLRDALSEKESKIAVKLENINTLKKALHKFEAFVSSTIESKISEKEVQCTEVREETVTERDRKNKYLPGQIKKKYRRTVKTRVLAAKWENNFKSLSKK